MPECRRKVSTATAFLPVVSCLSPASAFRHRHSGIRVQSGTPGHVLVRHCPMPSYGYSFVHELQGMLFFYSGISGFAILLVRIFKVCHSSVQELQGMLFFCSGAARYVILLFRSCRVCYSCLECGLEFRRKELGQGIREVGLAHGRIVHQVEGRH
jgi:hypothetical protein